jgi:ATP-binding cassette subfamily B protein
MLNDVELQRYSLEKWREWCGIVMQDGVIFSDTIANNISVGEDHPNKEKLFQAVSIANIRKYIEELPLRYNTMIGPEGVGLSQGQKQRILIARAVYKNPNFLFFDEATNALDTINEEVIMKNLNKFFKGRTVVIVAHRLSTVKAADQIIVLDEGKIVEIGTHDQLINQKASYYRLIKNQLQLGN